MQSEEGEHEMSGNLSQEDIQVPTKATPTRVKQPLKELKKVNFSSLQQKTVKGD